ncbi:hypothetical protein H5410_056683 [Solanum commersonii]|uniref:Uncharacterized protein n=1 Tax=Solanum commersonii TaxID=4109 RepID=A0A9J5WMG6_SOLCO|nr:hypothetical protein H5410_056683 [Solanum commersonii]
MVVRQDLRLGSDWSRWANRPIFKVIRSLEQVNPLFCSFLCASPWILLSSRISISFLPKIFVEVRQDLSYRAGWFRQVNRPIVQSIDLLMIKIFYVYFAKIFMEVHQDLSYGFGWSRWSMDLLVIRIYDVIFAKVFCGHPSRHLLWSLLFSMGKPAHFQGQTIPRDRNPTFYRFSCAIGHAFFG